MSIFLHRAGLIQPDALPAPASFVFNGTDEALLRTLSTSSPGTTIFTYSLWVKIAAFDDSDQAVLFQVINAPTNSSFLGCDVNTLGDGLLLEQDSGTDDWSENVSGLTPDIPLDTWTHLVFRFDSTNATADDRIRFYRNGTLLADAGTQPALNEAQRLFTNGRQHQIGAWLDVDSFLNGKLAFIDVVDGLSLAPTSFAFDNAGTWTRLNYTGSYGTYGFSLDGSDGFNDTSGNGQSFTGQNMTTGANLDTGDLPPYTN
jgi:hypothetical protein